MIYDSSTVATTDPETTFLQDVECLNEQQKEIVKSDHPHLLILAGAGSGKTRVLTHRIAWMILKKNISPSEILAVTFSNKAAQEMVQRLKKILGAQKTPSWIGTFHGLCHRMLKIHAEEAGLSPNFQILDGDDQIRLAKRLIKEAQLDSNLWPPKRLIGFIQKQKDQGLPPQKGPQVPIQYKIHHNLYLSYQQACTRAHLLDFTDLILRTLYLWKKNPKTLEYYQNKFRLLLIDEFQDTDMLQYLWMQTLSSPATHIMAVGDDDQCIYGWRGAQVSNLFKFSKEFKEVKIIRLEQNYRSTPQILEAANHLIQHNKQRFGKNLWSDGDSGNKIEIYNASSELDEAFFIAQSILELIKKSINADEIAVLYRTNAQSRAIEEALLRLQIPYNIYGGVRFFERQEIKHTLSYLRVLLNVDDDEAVERIINVPVRGIGEKTIQDIRLLAEDQHCSLWQALLHLTQPGNTINKKYALLEVFTKLILNLQQLCQDQTLSEIFRIIIEHTGLKLYYSRSQYQDPFGVNNKLENLYELVGAGHHFELQYRQEKEPETNVFTVASQFLVQAALDQAHLHLETVQFTKKSPLEKSVHLMTLHASKGLEFDSVFIPGWEEGIFPSELSKDSQERIEEERRLAYVGITRAKRFLCLSCSESRSWHGRINKNLPSRFLKELPESLIFYGKNASSKTMQKKLIFKSESNTEKKISYASLKSKIGKRVRHPKFGEGIVQGIEEFGEQVKIYVNFKTANAKCLLAEFAKLEFLN